MDTCFHFPIDCDPPVLFWDASFLQHLEESQIGLHRAEIIKEWKADGEHINAMLKPHGIKYKNADELLAVRTEKLDRDLEFADEAELPLQRVFTVLLHRGATRYKYARHWSQDGSKDWAEEELENLLFAGSDFSISRERWFGRRDGIVLCETAQLSFVVTVACSSCEEEVILRNSNLLIKDNCRVPVCHWCRATIETQNSVKSLHESIRRVTWLQQSKAALKKVKQHLQNQQV